MNLRFKTVLFMEMLFGKKFSQRGLNPCLGKISLGVGRHNFVRESMLTFHLIENIQCLSSVLIINHELSLLIKVMLLKLLHT